MPKHLFLPKLIIGASISEPTNDAVWENNDHQVIQAISDGIEVDEAAQARGVSSIPDIYARPLTFLGGFKSDKHPLRKRIVQEWRGLLSLLALHLVKHGLGKMTVSAVALNNEKFAKALLNLADRPIRLEKNGTEYLWSDFLLIKFNDIPLGAFSPATLVFTSADYNERLKNEEFPLKDEDGYLKPPSDAADLAIVGKWLENFYVQFNQLAESSDTKPDHRYTRDINKMLEDWLKEIRLELQINKDQSKGADMVRVADALMIENLRENPPQMLRRYAIYRQLLVPMVVDDSKNNTSPNSDYSLETTRNRFLGSKPIKEVVVITAGLLGQGKKVWKNSRAIAEEMELNEYVEHKFPGATGNKFNDDMEDAIWIRPELYFLTDFLLSGKTEDILHPEEEYFNADTTKYILPFKKEILQFFSPEEIQQKLRPKFEIGDTKTIFSFTLPLVNNLKAEIKKTYRNRNEVRTGGEGGILKVDIPVVEIFPNYSGDFWCQYFLMNSMMGDFAVTPINLEAVHEVTQKTQRYESSGQGSVQINLQRISGYNSFPEGVEISYNNSIGGLILLRRNPDFNNHKLDNEEEVTIGVDFGTSNTNIYYLKNGNPVKTSLAFADYTRRLTNASVTQREEIEKLFFIPTKNIELPIPTTIRRYYLGQSEFILFDHFIYFPTGYQYENNVSANIKWDNDDSKMNCFIESLVFLLMLDIVQKKMGKVKIKCTYPKSFTDQRKSAYNATWQLALQSSLQFGSDISKSMVYKTLIFALEDVGGQNAIITNSEYKMPSISLGNLIIDTSPAFVSEGEATGHYFSSDKIFEITDRANKKCGAICIDVGGGTSDFSVWFNNQIVYDCSVRLAGGQIADLLASNARLYPLLFSESAIKPLQAVTHDLVRFSSVLNNVLKKEGAEISARMVRNVNSKEIAWLRRSIAIEFGALSFFAGHIALAVSQIFKSEFKNSVKENGIRLHWGGNAAKLISWIDYGKFDPDGIAVKFLNGMFINTILNPKLGDYMMDEPNLLGQIQSKNHKDEASGGAVLMDTNKKDSTDQKPKFSDQLIRDEEDEDAEVDTKKVKADGILLSEPMTINGKDYQHFDLLKRERFFDKGSSLVEKLDLEQFSHFIKVLNGIGKRNGLFPEDYQIRLSNEFKISLKAEMIAKFDEMALQDEAKRDVQPPFITAVSQFLKEYVNTSR